MAEQLYLEGRMLGKIGFLTCKIGFIPPRAASRIKEDKKFFQVIEHPGPCRVYKKHSVSDS